MKEPAGVGIHGIFSTWVVEDTEGENAHIRELDDELYTGLATEAEVG